MEKLLTPLKLILIADGLENQLQTVTFSELAKEVAETEKIMKRELTSLEVESLIIILERGKVFGELGENNQPGIIGQLKKYISDFFWSLI